VDFDGSKGEVFGAVNGDTVDGGKENGAEGGFVFAVEAGEILSLHLIMVKRLLWMEARIALVWS